MDRRTFIIKGITAGTIPSGATLLARAATAGPHDHHQV